MIDLRNLKEIRKDANVGQKEISKILNIKSDAYSKYETNGAIPSLEVIYNFAKYFELNIDYVLGLREKRTKAVYSNYDKNLVANNIRVLRINKGLSQQGLAIKLGVSQAAVNRYEHALSNPSLNILYKYCSLFNISFHELVSFKLKVNN